MRLYLKDLDIHNTQIANDLSGIVTNKKLVVDIYTADGIYQLADNKLVRLDIADHPGEEIECNGTSLIVDKSVTKRIASVYRIPSRHHICTVEKHTYSLRRQSKISLVAERVKSKIVQVYFETAEDINNYAIQEDFTTLLSLLTKY